MSTSIIDGDLIVRGKTTPQGGLTLPTGSVGDAQIDPTNPITAAKLQQQINRVYEQGRGASVASKTGEPVHVARAAGTVDAIDIGVTVAGVSWAGGGKLTVDLLKNGSSVLSGVITVDGTTAAFAKVSGTISSAAYSSGDVFEVVVTVTAGTGTIAQGLFVRVVFKEAAQ
jgi:hypothetical protein